MRWDPLLAVGAVAGALGCAPATVSMTAPNPARATAEIEATQCRTPGASGSDDQRRHRR